MTLQQAIVLVLQVSIILTVFGFGLQATPRDMLYVLRRPSLLGRSLVAIFVIMPILTIVLTRVFTLRPVVEIVLVALSLSPIPPLLPGRQEKAGGTGSYGLGLMAIAGVLSIVTVPATAVVLGWYFTRPLGVPAGAIAGMVLLMAILPLAAGLLCRAMLPGLAARIAKPTQRVALALLAVGLLVVLAGLLPTVLELLGNGTLVAMAVFVGVGLAIGHWMGGPEADDRPVLALATASRHPAIALAIARVNFPDEPNLGPAVLLFLLVNLLVAVPYEIRGRRRRAATADARA